MTQPVELMAVLQLLMAERTLIVQAAAMVAAQMILAITEQEAARAIGIVNSLANQ